MDAATAALFDADAQGGAEGEEVPHPGPTLFVSPVCDLPDVRVMLSKDVVVGVLDLPEVDLEGQRAEESDEVLQARPPLHVLGGLPEGEGGALERLFEGVCQAGLIEVYRPESCLFNGRVDPLGVRAFVEEGAADDPLAGAAG